MLYVCMYVKSRQRILAENIESTTTNGVITRSHPLELLLFGLEVIICQGHCLQLIIQCSFSVWYVYALSFITEDPGGVITHSHPLKLLLFGLEVIFTRATVCNKQSAYTHEFHKALLSNNT